MSDKSLPGSDRSRRTGDPGSGKKPPASQSKDRDMGSALRSVYQKTVDETVPDDLLALLGKLD